MAATMVWKHVLPVDDQEHTFPQGQVLHAASQSGRLDQVEVWVAHPHPANEQPHTLILRVFGTGQLIPEQWDPLGTALAGPLVWHICRREAE